MIYKQPTIRRRARVSRGAAHSFGDVEDHGFFLGERWEEDDLVQAGVVEVGDLTGERVG